jgi:hypothetical protein
MPVTPQKVNLVFGLGSTTLVPADGFVDWDTFFDNQDVTNCPITSCEICSSSKNVMIENISPWGLLAKRDVKIGYTDTICVQCNNTLESTKFEGWVVTQLG